MSYNSYPVQDQPGEEPYQPGADLAMAALEEVRATAAEPAIVTADIDVVWGLSAPGTFYDPANKDKYTHPYTGTAGNPMTSFDRHIINHSVGVVYGVTALRLGKDVSEITKEDIAEHGPIFYYNGEDENTANVNYHQNRDLQRAVDSGEFPLPASNVKIGTIPTIGTPGQFEGIAAYVTERNTQVAASQAPKIGKIAMVSGIAHTMRTHRYLKHNEGGFPDDVAFVSLPVPLDANGVPRAQRMAILATEARKTAIYANKGHMSKQPYDKFAA